MKTASFTKAIGFAPLLWLFLFGGCSQQHDHEPGHSHEHKPGPAADTHDHEQENILLTTPSTPLLDAHAGKHEHGYDPTCDHLEADIFKDLEIRTQVVQAQAYASTMKIPGVAQVDPDRKVDISAPLAARIVKLSAPLHATVRPGDRVATLEVVDPGVRQLQVQAVEIRAELLGIKTERNRTRTYLEALQGQGGTAAREHRRVEADLKVLEAKLNSRQSSLVAMLASLQVAGLSPAQIRALKEKGTTVTSIALYAPRLSGQPDLEVALRPVHQGQTVALGDTLYTLVALDRLLVIGEAFEDDLPVVRRASRENLPVSLEFPAGQIVTGLNIFSVEGALDGEERITHFFMRLDNRLAGEKTEGQARYQDWEYRAGARVQIRVMTAKQQERIVLPVGALLREGGRQFMFRVHQGGCDRIAVRVESVDDRQVVLPLDGGLHPGDVVIVEGTLAAHLAFEQASKGKQVGTDHGHQH